MMTLLANSDYFIIFLIVAVLVVILYAIAADLRKTIVIASILFVILSFVWLPYALLHQVNKLNVRYLEKDLWGTKLTTPFYDKEKNMTKFKSMFHFKIEIKVAENIRDCQTYTPTVDDTAVNIEFCADYDNTEFNWEKRMKEYNRYSQDEINAILRQNVAQFLPSGLSQVTIKDLDRDKNKVSMAVYPEFAREYSKFGYKLNAITMTNWDFSDPSIATVYDSLAMDIKAAENKEQIANLEAKASLARVKSLAEQMDFLSKQAETLGFKTPEQKLIYLSIMMGDKNQSTFVLNGNSNAPIIPVPNNP